jgi:5-methylcytosine-specific restriction endonuclease McrA
MTEVRVYEVGDRDGRVLSRAAAQRMLQRMDGEEMRARAARKTLTCRCPACVWDAEQKETREKIAVHGRRRRARLLSAPVNDLTASEWFQILREHKNRCAYCGADGKLTQDHKTPLCRGGSHTASNVVPACGLCNSRKGRRTYEEFVEVIAGLNTTPRKVLQQ